MSTPSEKNSSEAEFKQYRWPVGGGPSGKTVTLMNAAAGAADLDPAHAVAVVVDLDEMLFVERSVERRPAGFPATRAVICRSTQPAITGRAINLSLLRRQPRIPALRGIASPSILQGPNTSCTHLTPPLRILLEIINESLKTRIRG